jgi:hypothetical protein
MLSMSYSTCRPIGGLLVACLLALAGCDNPPPPPVRFDAGHRDAGHRDAGHDPMDAARSDGAVAADGGRDGARPTGAAGPPACTLDPSHVWKIGRDVSGDRTVGLAAGGDAFGLVWTQVPTDGAVPEVHGVRLSSTGELGSPQQISEPPGAKRPPTVAAVGTTWIAAWVDNSEDAFEVRTRALASDLSVSAATSVNTVTDTPTALEDNPLFIETSSGLMLAWVEDDMVALTRTARDRMLDTMGVPSGAAQTASAAERQPGQLAGGELASGPHLVWTEGMDGIGEVYLQPLTSSGASDGAATAISAEANADGTIDAVLHPSGGAVVFGALVDGVRSEVRFRAFDGDGTPSGDERVMGNGSDASIASFAGGYAISYRAAASETTPPQIHLLLADLVGDVVEDLIIADAAPSGGRTTVRVSGDGQIAVAWADRADPGTDIDVALITCGSGG